MPVLSKIFAGSAMSWNNSLRKRLMAGILVPIIVSMIGTGLFTGITTYNEANEIYDAQLSYMAKALLAIEIKETGRRFIADDSPDVELYSLLQRGDKKLAFRVWRNGVVWHRSTNAEHFGAPIGIDGFSTRKLSGKYWHVFVLSDIKDDIVVEVAERDLIRREMTWLIVGSITLPMLVLIPLIFLFIRRGITWGLHPLHQLSQEVSRRSPNDLTRIITDRQPKELWPILQSLNGLLDQLHDALEAERRFTDYAAHELRTPLTAIKTLFHAACHSTDVPERERLVSKLRQAIDRATHLVAQLLALARISSEALEIAPQNLGAMVQEAAEELAYKIRNKQQHIEWELPSTTIQATTHGALLHSLVLNVLRNAIYYTPEGGKITINLQQNNGHSTLTITDTGPGIPEHEHEKVFQSFYRGEMPNAHGAGLGLAIVRNISQKLHITVQLKTPKHHSGLAVTLVIPNAL